ncbi:glycosyltransferase family 2 protein [Chloroflexota bacterium]
MPQPSESSQKTKPKIIATIPCFNTSHFIEDVVSKTRKYVDQVIAVDDGSQDNTAEAARSAGALVISHSANKGYGEAIKSCFEAARANNADILVIIDGDGQHNPEEIPKLLAPIFRGKADLVIGSRFICDGGNMPSYRKFGIRVITFLFNLGSRIKVSDAQSGFRSYHRRFFSDLPLTERGMSISIETLQKARAKRTVIEEVPVSCHYVWSTFHSKIFRHGLSVALAVIRIRFKSLLRER